MPKPVPVKRGLVFWLIPAGECTHPHPWFVISDEVSGKVLTVNVTDAKNYQSTCVLAPGDHPDITKPSAVFYRMHREREAAGIGLALGAGIGIRHLKDASPALLTRIITGLIASTDVTDAIKVKYGFIPPKPKGPGATF